MDEMKEKIYDAYTAFVAEHGTRPQSIDLFMADAGLPEVEFYKKFSTFSQLEKAFWKDLFLQTIKQIQKEEVFQSYSVREKLLAMYFTCLEYIKGYHAYSRLVFKREQVWQAWPGDLDDMKKEFVAFCNELIVQGKMSGEIADRVFVTDYYGNWLWLQAIFILKFWVKDESDNFENTDAAIEKSVNFTMDLIVNNSIDSFLDLSKFIVQKW